MRSIQLFLSALNTLRCSYVAATMKGPSATDKDNSKVRNYIQSKQCVIFKATLLGQSCLLKEASHYKRILWVPVS